MKKEELKTLSIKLTATERRYAMAISKRYGICPRPNQGSIAHGLKQALRVVAKIEKIDIFE